MENMNEMDLGLALGITNQRHRGVELCSNRDAGAGANANSRLRIDTVVGPRPLSELVWSTQNGLSIKSASCSNNCFTDKKKPCCILRDVIGPTQIDDEKCHVISPRSITLTPFLGSSLSHTDENVDEAKCVHLTEMENCNKGKEKECMSSSESIPDGNVAGTSEGPKSQIFADLLPVLLAKEPQNIGDGTDRFNLDLGLSLKTQDMSQSACQERPLPNLTKEEDCITAGCAPFLEKIEETAENDVILKNVILKNAEREDSHGESMNSGNNRLSKRNKRWRFEEHLIIESKRIKKQSQQCTPPPTPPVVKQQDSSFMNWISNMVKGVKPIRIDDHKTLNLENKRLGFQSVFQSLYSQDAKRVEETKKAIESSKSKEIILFNKTVSCHIPDDDDDDDDDDSLNQKACGNLWITRLSPKTPSSLLTSNNNSSDNVFASVGLKQLKACEIDAFKDTRQTCLQINENRNVLLKKKVSNLKETPKQIALTSKNNKLSNEDKILKIPKQMFDTIKRLRLSRTDVLKWMNSGLPIANLDGYFLRVRLAKWEGVGGTGYYVACITDENPSKGLKKTICVNIGGVQCLVESRYISNCDFLQDELIAWWRTTLTSGRAALIEKDLTSKLEERNKLGF